jgi:hypothetical protein
MAFRDDVKRIRHMCVHQVAAQDWDVAEFIRVVGVYSKTDSRTRREHPEYREILVKFYNQFRSNIFSYLRTKSNGKQIHNAVYFALFGKPWGLRFEAGKEERRMAAEKFQRSVVSAIRSYPREHYEQLQKHLLRMSYFSPISLGRMVKDEVVEEVQIALKTIDREDVLNAIIGQKSLIYQALVDMLADIMKSQHMKRLSGSGKEVKMFAEPIFDKIMLEIEAKKALVKKKAAVAA